MSAFDFISPADSQWEHGVKDILYYEVRDFILHPQQWTNCSPVVPHLSWERVRFDTAGIASIPSNQKGLYSFVAEPSVGQHDAIKYLLYIGETHDQDLRSRCRSYLTERRKKKPRIHIAQMVSKWPNHLWIHYVVVNDASKIKQLEDELIAAFLPPFNRQFPAILRARVRAAL